MALATLCYIMLRYVTLCYVMLCYIMLRYVTLCYVMLHYATLCYIMLRYVTLCYIMLHYATLCYIMLRYVTLCYIMLHYATLCYIMLHYATCMGLYRSSPLAPTGFLISLFFPWHRHQVEGNNAFSVSSERRRQSGVNEIVQVSAVDGLHCRCFPGGNPHLVIYNARFSDFSGISFKHDNF